MKAQNMRTFYLLTVVVLLLLQCESVGSAKILFAPFPSYSHVQQMSYIADALVANGHEAWMIALPKVQKKLRLTERKIQAAPFNKSQEMEALMYKLLQDPESGFIHHYLHTGKRSIEFLNIFEIVDMYLTDQSLTAAILKQKFDLVVIDTVPFLDTFSILPYKYGIPFVYFGNQCNHFGWRIPFSPAFVPFRPLPYTDQMDFTGRLINTLAYTVIGVLDPFIFSNGVAHYAPEKPFINREALQRHALLAIVESNPLLEYPYPTMPNVITIGSLAPRIETQLPKHYAEFLDRSQNGVILVSFGSIVPNDNFPVLEKLATAFTNTKYDFVIKGSYMKNSSRVLISDWIPQKALLKHRKVKMFATHCGGNGVGEAINYGKPMLCFPIFGDQPAIAARAAARGYGLDMDLFSAKSDEITANINEIMENPSYRTAIERASKIARSFEKQEKPSEVVAFWIDHVIKFGGDHLRSSSSEMPLYQYFLLDVLAFILLILSVVALVVFYCVKICCRKIRSRKLKEKLS